MLLFIMEKFLKIPVTNEQKQLVSVLDVKLVEVGNASGASPTTTTTLFYGSGKKVTLTHAAVPAGSEAMRDAVQDAMVEALATGWTEVFYEYVPAYAVSGIAIA